MIKNYPIIFFKKKMVYLNIKVAKDKYIIFGHVPEVVLKDLLFAPNPSYLLTLKNICTL